MSGIDCCGDPSQYLPKFAFIAWMAILNRLPTMDRLQAWGMEVEGTCVLCKQDMENRNHLFFGCSFSRNIWKGVLELCGLRREVWDWEEELKWAYQKLKGASLLSIILRSAWNACVYFVWNERNCRLYMFKEETNVQVLERIKQKIRLRLAGLKNVKVDQVNNSLYIVWDFSQTIFA